MQRKFRAINVNENIYTVLSILKLPGESFNMVLRGLLIENKILDKECKITKDFLKECAIKRKAYIRHLKKQGNIEK